MLQLDYLLYIHISVKNSTLKK